MSKIEEGYEFYGDELNYFELVTENEICIHGFSTITDKMLIHILCPKPLEFAVSADNQLSSPEVLQVTVKSGIIHSALFVSLITLAHADKVPFGYAESTNTYFICHKDL